MLVRELVAYAIIFLVVAGLCLAWRLAFLHRHRQRPRMRIDLMGERKL